MKLNEFFKKGFTLTVDKCNGYIVYHKNGQKNYEPTDAGKQQMCKDFGNKTVKQLIVGDSTRLVIFNLN